MEKDDNIEESNAYAWSDIGSDQVALFYRNEENIASYASRTGCWPRKPKHPMFAPSLDDTMALLESFRKNGNPFENGWYDNSLFLSDWIDHTDHDWRLVTEPSVAAWAESLLLEAEGNELSAEYIDEAEEGLRNLMRVLNGGKAPIPASYWEFRFPDIADSPSLALEEEPFILESLMEYLLDQDEPEDEELFFTASVLADPDYSGSDIDRAMKMLSCLMHESDDESIGARAALLFAELVEDEDERFFALTEAAALGSRPGRIALAETFIERDAEKAALSILKRFSEEFLSTLLKGNALPDLMKAHALLALHAESEDEEMRYLKLARLGIELLGKEDELEARFSDMIRLQNLGFADRFYIGMLAESAIRDQMAGEEAEDLLDCAEEEIENTEWPEYDDGEEESHFLSDSLALNFIGADKPVFEFSIKNEGSRMTIRRKDGGAFFFESDDSISILEGLTVKTLANEPQEENTILVDRIDDNGFFHYGYGTVLSPIEDWEAIEMKEAEFED